MFLKKILLFHPATLLKRDSNTVLSCENCEIFQNTFFNRNPAMNVSEETTLKTMQSFFRYFDKIAQTKTGDYQTI